MLYPKSVGFLLAATGAQSLLLLEDPATVLFRLRGDGNLLPQIGRWVPTLDLYL